MAHGTSGVGGEPKNTKRVPRRALRFESVAEVRAEVDRLERAHEAGTLRTTGNWSAGQNLLHLAEWVQMYQRLDFPEVPWFVRIAGRLMRGRMVNKGFPAGMPGPGNKPYDLPACTFEAGAAKYREALDVLESADLSHDNPLFGRMSRDDAVRIQLRHAELHLGFFDPGSGDAETGANAG